MKNTSNKNNHNNRNSYSFTSLFCPNRFKDRTFNKRLVTLPKKNHQQYDKTMEIPYFQT